MVAARIAAICLALASCTALSQQPANTSITVTVTDQTGAVILGARVWATKQASSSRLEATVDTSGHAILTLEPGRYDLRVQARAFKTWEEHNVEVATDLHRTVSLAIDQQLPCMVCVESELISADHPQLTAEVASIPMQQLAQLAVPSKRLRSRSH